VTHKQLTNQDALDKSARNFVANIKKEMKVFGPENVLNSDQSGFRLELRSGRTQTYKGTRSVEAVVQSLNATTHSYTIQPTITADGKFVGPMLLLLQEPQGTFGPIVKRTMFKVRTHVK